MWDNMGCFSRLEHEGFTSPVLLLLSQLYRQKCCSLTHILGEFYFQKGRKLYGLISMGKKSEDANLIENDHLAFKISHLLSMWINAEIALLV